MIVDDQSREPLEITRDVDKPPLILDILPESVGRIRRMQCDAGQVACIATNCGETIGNAAYVGRNCVTAARINNDHDRDSEAVSYASH